MDVFTAYIFKEDHGKLTEESLQTTDKGGRLLGQWTSTGNPVVHRAMSFQASRSDTEIISEAFSNGFKLCHIGEWRPVKLHGHGGNEHPETRARKDLLQNYRGARPSRFLVLDVERTRITPYLFEGQEQKGRGKLEILEGVNPFNTINPRGLYQQPQLTQGNNPPHHGGYSYPWGATGQSSWNQGRSGNPYKEAVTTTTQWYSGEKGTTTLQRVHGDLKKIAVQEQVAMSRDSTSQEISMSFTDKHHRMEWEVKFPWNFPFGETLLIESPRTSRSRKEHKQASSDKAITVVKNITTFIKNKTSIY